MCDFAVICLGLFEPCRIDCGLVSYYDLSFFTRSNQTWLPILGKGDSHSSLTAIGGIVVYGIGLAGLKTADFHGIWFDSFNKGFPVSGRGRRIYVVNDCPGQTTLWDIDNGLPRNLHALLVNLCHSLVDVDNAVFGNNLARAPVRLAAIGHNDVA